MNVPNDFAVVASVYASGDFDLTTHDGQAAFVDAVVRRLHLQDRHWGHLRKKPGQTHLHGHAEDAALYKGPDNQARAVDFIAGAGGQSPSLRWGVDSFPYTHADWLDPDDHDGTHAPPPSIPSYESLGGDLFFRVNVGVPLSVDMTMAGQALNEGSSVWFSRTCYSLLEARLKDPSADHRPIVKKHRNEWRAILGLPQLP